MVNYAVQNGMQVRGHALVEHRQTPPAYFNGSSATVLQRMRAAIPRASCSTSRAR